MIIFNGKRIDNGERIFGSLITNGELTWIMPKDIRPDQVISTSLHRINIPAFLVGPKTIKKGRL